jgi:alkylated DNA repair dioxygenase AlkB
MQETQMNKKRKLGIPADGYMQIHRQLFPAEESLFEQLLSTLQFDRPKPFCGNMVRRETAFLHMPEEDPIDYRFGGQTWTSKEIPPEALDTVLKMLEICKLLSHSAPNVVLIQLYQDDGSISWHADDESKAMVKIDDEVLPITSFSLGGNAEFCIRPKTGKPRRTQKMLLQNGDVLVMKQGAQERYEHRIARGGIAAGSQRMSFTFRTQK